MDRMPVSSSNIASVGYEADSQVLEVEYIKGGIYQYMNVPGDIHEELMNCSSKGTYMNQVVKKMFVVVQVG
jgi:hypothetical protein